MSKDEQTSTWYATYATYLAANAVAAPNRREQAKLERQAKSAKSYSDVKASQARRQQVAL